MEFFIILIVVVVVYNLFNSATQRQKAAQAPAPPRHQGTVVQHIEQQSGEPPGERHFYRERSVPLGKLERVQPNPDRREESAEPLARPAQAAKQARPLPAHADAYSLPVRSGSLAANLQSMFGDKERLVAGFIFHEILGPPRGLRKR